MKRITKLCQRLSRESHNKQYLEKDPLDSLIATILSQNTSDINSHRAFASLKQKFPTWQKALHAPQEQIEKAIVSGGLAKIKSARIQQVLATLADEQGVPSLKQLRKMNNQAAREFLMSLPGVGMKTASCVLLFSLGRAVCPVDTHVLRVAKRIGVIAPELSADQATLALEAILPETCMYTFHVGLIRIGRTVCRPRLPRCPECIVQNLCDYAQQMDS